MYMYPSRSLFCRRTFFNFSSELGDTCIDVFPGRRDGIGDDLPQLKLRPRAQIEVQAMKHSHVNLIMSDPVGQVTHSRKMYKQLYKQEVAR